MPVIGVFAGPTLSGKSTLRERVSALPEFKDVPVVVADHLRDLWFNRPICQPEADYCYELARQEIKSYAIGSKRESVIFCEMPLRHGRKHQDELVYMAEQIEVYLKDISRSKPDEHIDTAVHLRVMTLFARLDIIPGRVEKRLAEPNTSRASVFKLEKYLRVCAAYHVPTRYEPLYLNTSDESDSGNASTLALAVQFLKSGRHPEDNNIHREAFVGIMKEARDQAISRKLGWSDML